MSRKTLTQMGHLKCLIRSLYIISLSSDFHRFPYTLKFYLTSPLYLLITCWFFTLNRLPLPDFHRTRHFYLDTICLQVSEKETSYNFKRTLGFFTFKLKWEHKNNVRHYYISISNCYIFYFTNCILFANVTDTLGSTFLPEKPI